jgi:hypothetical protein
MTEQGPTEQGVAVVGAPKAPAGAAAAAPPRRRRFRARTVTPGAGTPGAGTPRWLAPVLAALVVVLLVTTIVFAVSWSDLSSQNDQRAAVKRVATDFLVALTNFDPTNIDSRFRTIASYATGDFAKQSNAFFGTQIRQELEQVQARSQGQVRYCYVQDLQGNQASVYAEVDQAFANSKFTSVQSDVLQLAVALTDTSSGWKIADVSVLQGPNPNGSSSGGGSNTSSTTTTTTKAK